MILGTIPSRFKFSGKLLPYAQIGRILRGNNLHLLSHPYSQPYDLGAYTAINLSINLQSLALAARGGGTTIW